MFEIQSNIQCTLCLHVQVFEEKDKNFLSEFVLKPF